MSEILEGYVIDIACIRKYSRKQLLAASRKHSSRCALMGHCLESGYGLVDEDNRLFLLDSAATFQIAETIQQNKFSEGLWLRIVRKPNSEEEMETVEVQATARLGSK